MTERQETLDTYLDRAAARAPLAPADERALVERARAGDAAARADLVEAFLPLVAGVAATYRNTATVQRVELVQEGVVGLLRALERYDPGRGVPFWGYAAWWVRQAMQQLVAELTRPAVLSDRALRHLARLKDAHRAALRESGREPSADDLVERTGLSTEQVADLLAVERPARSLEEPVGGEEGAIGTFGELLVDPLAEDEYERVLRAIETEELLGLLANLSERERMVLAGRYGLEGHERSLRELGGELGLSAERVRQVEARALGKLAAASGAERSAPPV
ncbi:MAG TPA: sigma-70 family RNA polymerase sigma factor [Solirubrobacteraceae bacterium]|nr:sigma-70 family RNA polymerase sigma factor [Solirubrobacteraceae bacterium]